MLVAGEVREQPQLDLRVVGRHEQLARRERHERLADLAAELRTHGDVLQVRVRRGQAAGRRDRLVEARVHAPVAGAHARQGIDVGGLDLGKLAVAQHERGQVVLMRELLEHGRVGGVAALVLLEGLQAQHLEQNARELLGGIEVELLPRHVEYASAQFVELGLRGCAQLGQTVAVHRGTRALHDGEHGHERQVDVEVRARAAVALKRLRKRPHELARRSGLEGGRGRFVLRLGQNAPAVGVEQRVEGVLRHRRIQHVAGQPQVERAHAHEVGVVHKGALGSVGRIDAVKRLLHIERGERSALHDARERGQALVVLEQRGPLARGHGAVQPRVEQRHLFGLHERHPQRLAARDGGIHQFDSPRPRDDGLDRKRSSLAFELFAHELEHAVEMGVEPHLLERLGHGLRIERREAAPL